MVPSGPLASGHRAHHVAARAAAPSSPAVFVWCLVSWGRLQAELNGIALSVAGPLIALFTRWRLRARGRGGHRVRGHVPGACSLPRRPRQSRYSPAHRVPEHGAGPGGRFAGYAALQLIPERTRAIESARLLARPSLGVRHHGPRCRRRSIRAAAERLVDRDPARQRGHAKGALEEIRAMIGVLRAGRAETTLTQGTSTRNKDFASYLVKKSTSRPLDETALRPRSCAGTIDGQVSARGSYEYRDAGALSTRFRCRRFTRSAAAPCRRGRSPRLALRHARKRARGLQAFPVSPAGGVLLP